MSCFGLSGLPLVAAPRFNIELSTSEAFVGARKRFPGSSFTEASISSSLGEQFTEVSVELFVIDDGTAEEDTDEVNEGENEVEEDIEVDDHEDEVVEVDEAALVGETWVVDEADFVSDLEKCGEMTVWAWEFDPCRAVRFDVDEFVAPEVVETKVAVCEYFGSEESSFVNFLFLDRWRSYNQGIT